MTRRQHATVLLATLLWVVLTSGLAGAMPRDAVDNAAAGFRTSRLVVDPAVASSISPSDTAALRGKLDHATTPILIAILPDSAVGPTPLAPIAVETTTYRLATTTAIPATVGMVLPQSHFFRATSSIVKPCPTGTAGCTPPGSPSGTADMLAIAAARAHGKQGLLPMVSDFVDSIQNAYAAQTEAGKPKPPPSHANPLGPILILLGLGTGGVSLIMVSRRSKQARRTGKTKVTAAWNDLGSDLVAHSDLADSTDEARRNAYLSAQSAYENAGGNMAHAKTAEDWSTIGEIVAGGRRSMLEAKTIYRPSPHTVAVGIAGTGTVTRMAGTVAEEPEPLRHRHRNGVRQFYYPAGSYMGRSWGGGWYGGDPWLQDVIMYEAMEDLVDDPDEARWDDDDRSPQSYEPPPSYDPAPTYDPPTAPSYDPPPSYDDPSSSGGGFDFGGGGDSGGGGGDW